jgi:hypothetical protein
MTMAARRKLEVFDDEVEGEIGQARGPWRLILTEADEIDEIAWRDAEAVSKSVRQKQNAKEACTA